MQYAETMVGPDGTYVFSKMNRRINFGPLVGEDAKSIARALNDAYDAGQFDAAAAMRAILRIGTDGAVSA